MFTDGWYNRSMTINETVEGGFSNETGSTPRVWDMSTPMMGPPFNWRITLVGKFFKTAPSTSTWSISRL